ncbi:HAD family hydrolase [Colwellia hornerae]|uniref:HAD family hydrolase n=1 Tax=Colwellia hornerae TaxID=89402 RepID=A0A5C6QK04_9GAMM|nr:HAD hydrolase-like protein [Colwellia hornerae]TWX54056.1 HAD family hydrolase [Colwellia hornerae]TWX60831.1 HAD family hydrolase [Colwellia hornerae]TWX69161.1 HAD family hydrolase [Colwellia hornerae]
MKCLSSYSVAIFDCDGVILDSNKIKSEAFGLALPDEDPALVKEFVEYHQQHGGISRYIKFEYFFKHIKKQTNYSKALESALTRYAALSKKGLLECSEIPGVRDILEYLNSMKTPCYVASGGDQQEIREVFKSRNLSIYFHGVFGSPLSKIDNLAQLKVDEKLISPGIFFGDARSDMEAANKYSLDFVYISGVSEWIDGTLCGLEQGFDVFNDFNQVCLNV